jgi:hypothetical protein
MLEQRRINKSTEGTPIFKDPDGVIHLSSLHASMLAFQLSRSQITFCLYVKKYYIRLVNNGSRYDNPIENLAYTLAISYKREKSFPIIRSNFTADEN